MRKIISATESEIPLFTAQGSELQNLQTNAVPVGQLMYANALLKQFGTGAQIRHMPTGMYNCHGLVFGSRRTTIYDRSEILMILSDDSYKEITPADVIEGDVIMYFSEKGDPEHSGIVLKPAHKDLLGIATVLSKWGVGHEVIHRANVCPYESRNIKYYRVVL